MKNRLLILFGGIILGYGFSAFTEWLHTKETAQRAHNLGLMRYHAKTDSFVPKDTIVLTGTELNYLITGKK